MLLIRADHTKTGGENDVSFSWASGVDYSVPTFCFICYSPLPAQQATSGILHSLFSSAPVPPQMGKVFLQYPVLTCEHQRLLFLITLRT